MLFDDLDMIDILLVHMYICLFQKIPKIMTCDNSYNVLNQYILVLLSFQSKPNCTHTNINMYFNIL